MKDIERMRELITKINEASDAYYNTRTELISNYEWDAMLAELEALERKTGQVFSQSPTDRVGYEPVSKLLKEAHEVPALSLEKTKDLDALAAFLGEREGILSWKLDGLTVVLTYEDGKLQKAVTRGNGQIGEVITANARQFANIPLTVPVSNKLIVRGEALITYEDFERVNGNLPEGEEPYKNPRNLCSGSVRQLDPNVTRARNVRFYAFAMALPDRTDTEILYRNGELGFLELCGFTVVGHTLVKGAENLKAVVKEYEKRILENEFPSDGLVLQLNDVAYGKSLGTTSRHPKDSLAFKWQDEIKVSVVKEILWSASRTGLINPVAVFEPVELEGTTVSKASVHNVSIVEDLRISPGDKIAVYKANMIIPQVADNLTRYRDPEIPGTCPVCGGKTEVRKANDAKTLWCMNPDCAAKHIGAFTHAVCRDALNIEGLSEETIRTLMDHGLLRSLPDLFRLKNHRERIIAIEGMGGKSFGNLVTAVETARTTTAVRLIYALGIPYVGRTASKLICNAFGHDVRKIVTAAKDELLTIPDIGDAIAGSFVDWFADQTHQELFEDLLSEVELERPLAVSYTPFAGYTFVITGSLKHFPNRDACKAKIEELGGKVSGSVSSKTTYLINNDATSASGKNKKARELGIPVITEETFLSMCEDPFERE